MAMAADEFVAVRTEILVSVVSDLDAITDLTVIQTVTVALAVNWLVVPELVATYLTAGLAIVALTK